VTCYKMTLTHYKPILLSI